MQVLWVLLSVKLKILGSVLFDRRKKYILRNTAMVVFLAVMLGLSYLFFYKLIFRYLIAIEDIGFLLIDRLVTIGFLVFFFLLIVSSFVISLGSLFRSAETEYLFSTPISVNKLFTSKFFDIIIFSSWTILLMALPILYSYARVREFGTFEYALTGIVALVPFIVIADSIGTMLAVLVRYASRYVRIQTIVFLSSAALAGFVFLIVFFSQPTQLKIEFREDFRALNYFINNFHLTSNPFLPNVWFIQSMRALSEHDMHEFVLQATALAVTAVFSVTLVYLVINKLYFKTWLISFEKYQEIRETSASLRKSAPKTFLFRPTKSQEHTLLNKDILIFFRDPAQWAQLLLLFTLLAIYFINLRFIPEDIELEQWRTILFLMNFGFCGFVLATMAVRFVFPSISLEGDTFWVIGSSPLSTKTLFREKFLSSFITFFIIAESVGLVSSGLLQIEGLYKVLTFGGIFLMSITLSCLAIGLGAIYPDFSERNPSKIVSSPGGILTIVLSLFYLGVMLTMITVPAYMYTKYLVHGEAFPMKELVVSCIVIGFVNILMIVIPLRSGAVSFARREF